MHPAFKLSNVSKLNRCSFQKFQHSNVSELAFKSTTLTQCFRQDH